MRNSPRVQTLTPAQAVERLQWRYATKQFDPDRAIPADAWQALEQALLLAPSSFGLQPWRFLVVADPATRARLREISWNQSQVTDAARLVVLASRTDLTDADIDRWTARIMEVRGSLPLPGYRDLMSGFAAAMPPAARHAWNARQTYIALGQLMATAAMMGIDSCPLEGIDPAGYDTELGLTGSGYATVAACALGYRAEGDKYASLPKVRYPADEVIRQV